jgi:hypothetical protein
MFSTSLSGVWNGPALRNVSWRNDDDNELS